MATIELNETTLYYEDTGPGSTGETIVFSHGLLWGTELFTPQIEALRERYRCIAWDHRGQGKSAADHRNSIDMELVWKDATLMLETLGTGPVHFVGLSMGGFVGMRMAARRPELVRSLILIETSSDPEPIENVPKYRMLTRAVRLLGPKVVQSRVTPIMLGKTILTDASRRADVARYSAIMARRKDIWRAVNGVIDRAGIHDELRFIRAPTLILVGDEDVATVPAKAEKMANAIRGATLAHIARAGHSSTVEEPAAVTAAIESFLRTLPPPRQMV
ncbi:MAG TPA: alpha/beta fold hydrolase [Kofleriaceae bacterium]|nr:alpha/beta fold hydrolase [Kofleriaceae bacterium]